MLILKGDRKTIMNLIRRHPHEREVFLKIKPSVYLLAFLLNNTSLRTLYVTEGVMRTIPRSVVRSLKSMNVRVVVKKVPRGRPYKYPTEVIRQALKLRKKGVPVTQIAERLGVSKRTLYYWFSHDSVS
ncbi:helix-turn-helix domain-containing protein [Candidatus Micrarchaeota archaeon]|nr:helix-turn-helix domain-containing protein [Candidatus Micrarchaeota archaeon]